MHRLSLGGVVRTLLGLLLVFQGIWFVKPVQAATQGIGLSPAIQEITLGNQQESAQFVMNLSNGTASAIELELSVVDFGSLDETGGIAFLGQTEQQSAGYGLKGWMLPAQNRISLAPGVSADVPVIIRNDIGLSPGGHYAAVVVSAVANQSGDDSVAVVPAATTLVLLKKTGGERYGLDLERLKANSSLINLPKSVDLNFKNTGNVHVVPRGTVELTGPFNRIIARGVINESSAFVLPASNRELKVPLTSYTQPWLPGRYTLTTTWRYDGREETVVQTRQFWYAGKLLIYLLTIVCTVYVLITYVRYRRRPPTRN